MWVQSRGWCGRLLGKLAEGDCEKLERLLRLHFSYTERVELAAEAALAVSEVGRGGEEEGGPRSGISPHISPYLPVSPHISPYLGP